MLVFSHIMVSVCMSRCVCACVCVVPLALFQVEFRMLVYSPKSHINDANKWCDLGDLQFAIFMCDCDDDGVFEIVAICSLQYLCAIVVVCILEKVEKVSWGHFLWTLQETGVDRERERESPRLFEFIVRRGRVLRWWRWATIRWWLWLSGVWVHSFKLKHVIACHSFKL